MLLPTSSARITRLGALAVVGSASFFLALVGGACGGGGPGSKGSGGGGGGGGGPGPDGGPTCGLSGTGATACGSAALPAITTELVVDGFSRPVYATSLPGTSDLLVVEQAGSIVRVHAGAIEPTPFLDVSVAFDNAEQGLFSIAFHPDYLSNGRFFVAYTSNATPSQNVVAEYHVSGDPLVADPAEVDRLLEVDDPFTNHNGAMLAFGQDGLLYASLGDSGQDTSCASPGCAQDTTQAFGKILRFDVDNAAGGYAVPCNPFTMPAGRADVWSFGLRNPWRFSFDRLTGDMYIADVGQDSYEEVDFVPAGTAPGLNFGWRGYEGLTVNDAAIAAGITDHYEPVVVQNHSPLPGADTQPVRNATCIIGGYAYRGSAIPDLAGYYFFGDCVSTDIAVFRMCDGTVSDLQRVFDAEMSELRSFGEDADGELYLVGGTSVRRIIAN